MRHICVHVCIHLERKDRWRKVVFVMVNFRLIKMCNDATWFVPTVLAVLFCLLFGIKQVRVWDLIKNMLSILYLSSLQLLHFFSP